MFEYIFLSLRLREGLDLEDFQSRFGQPLHARHQAAIERLMADNLIELTDRHLRLSRTGWLVADAVAEYF